MKSRQAIAQDVLSQALGTLIAAGVIFVIGKLAGILPGVDWGQVGIAALGLLAVVTALAGVASGWTGKRRQEEKRKKAQVEATLRNLTTEENVALHAYFDKARWNNLDPTKRKEFEALLAQAMQRGSDSWL